MTADWATGSGGEQQFYNPGSIEVQMMQNAPGVNKARDLFYNKNRNKCEESFQDLTNYEAGFGLRGLLRSGLNPIRQFIGNYRVDITVNGDGTVTFVLSNTTSFTSLFYGIGPSWSRDPFGLGWQLPGGNMEQYYAWTESIPSTAGLRCGCTK
jgi:hypothetical protein